jgi:hypothetical protein
VKVVLVQSVVNQIRQELRPQALRQLELSDGCQANSRVFNLRLIFNSQLVDERILDVLSPLRVNIKPDVVLSFVLRDVRKSVLEENAGKLLRRLASLLSGQHLHQRHQKLILNAKKVIRRFHLLGRRSCIA